jgi:Arc/MetJ family transcription regulator
MNTNIFIDNDLMTQAIDLSEEKTQKDIIDIALREYVAKRRTKSLAQLKGKIEFADGYNYKELRCGE